MADLGAVGYTVPVAAPAGLRYAGTHCVRGVTISAGSPESRRVLLLTNAPLGYIVGETTSDSNGECVFNYIAPGLYLVLGLDDTGYQNGVVATHIESEPMGT